MIMAIQIVEESRKLIKPATPTPPTLRHYKIGFTDELNPPINIGTVLFFSANTTINNHNPNFVAHLEKSLENTLTRFYPLAGRYLEQTHVVDCNDQGVEFIHSKVNNIKLQDILGSKEENLKLVDEFMPLEFGAADQVTDPLLSVQVTKFEECQGLALGVSISHRIADAATLSTFLNEWAIINREQKELVEFNGPVFYSSSIFPPRGLPPLRRRTHQRSKKASKFVVTKKLSFSESEMSDLKQKMVVRTGRTRPQWSKVTIVSALIWKGLIEVDRRRTHGYTRDSILLQPVNLRGKTGSLIPKDCCGNLCTMLVTEGKKSAETTTIEGLADVIKNSVTNFINNCFKIRDDNEEVQTMVLNSYLNMANVPPTTNVILISSWCNIPIYEADFGFGKPVWVSCGLIPGINTAHLMDGVGGKGVDAYVGLEDKDAPFFEQVLQLQIKAFDA